VEIQSPNDTVGEIHEKIEEYPAARIPLVWLVDPRHRSVTIYRPDQEPEFVNARQELNGEPELPGFCVRVADLFA
jgi:Uma2 family endonuclease